MSSLAIIPHNDDESLFLAFTLLREKPLVLMITDSFIQAERGDGITWKQRRNESLAAMKILGCPIFFAGISDTQLDAGILVNLFESFRGFDKVYAPAIQGGNWQHDLISKIAQDVFPNLIQYTTYTKTELHTTGSVEIKPTPQELELKNRALDCYTSQLNLPSTRPHFAAVRGKSEFYL